MTLDDLDILEEYPEAAEPILEAMGSFFTQMQDDDVDLSDDALLQVLQDCSNICDMHDVPDEDRLDLMFGALKKNAYENIDQQFGQLRWQIETFRDL